jgi:hypothetical protein
VEEFEHLEGLELIDYFDYSTLARKVVDVLQRPVNRTPNSLQEQDLEFTLPVLSDILTPEASAADTSAQSADEQSGVIEIVGTSAKVEEILVDEEYPAQAHMRQTPQMSTSSASPAKAGTGKSNKRRRRR